VNINQRRRNQRTSYIVNCIYQAHRTILSLDARNKVKIDVETAEGEVLV
jgi:hypothetical protein